MMSSNKPTDKFSLISWFTRNQGVPVIYSMSLTVREGNLPTLAERAHFVSSEKRYISRVTEDGVYVKTESGTETWLHIKDLDFIFTEQYFAWLFIENNPEDSAASIKVCRYEYTDLVEFSQNVRGILNCSVGDVNYDVALKRLSNEELEYCLAHESRKTGIKKLKSQAKKNGL